MRRGVGRDEAHADAGQVLSDGVALYIVRCGAGLSLPMVGCLSRPWLGRFCGDARVLRHRRSGIRLCVEDWSIGMGVESSVAQNLPETATLDLLLATFEEDVQEISSPQGDATAVVLPGGLKRIMEFLNYDARTRFNLLVDITAVDYRGRKPRHRTVAEKVTFTIDGLTVQSPKGISILEAAKQVGIKIPYYCYHPGLSVVANCRMCLVEIE